MLGRAHEYTAGYPPKVNSTPTDMETSAKAKEMLVALDANQRSHEESREDAPKRTMCKRRWSDDGSFAYATFST